MIKLPEELKDSEKWWMLSYYKVRAMKGEDLTIKEFKQICEMEKDLFPPELREEKGIKNFDENGMFIVSYTPENDIAGYAYLRPYVECYEELKGHDNKMIIKGMKNALYLDSIAIKKEFHGKGYFSLLVKKMRTEAELNPIIMHARTTNNCSLGMKHRGATKHHSVDNWFGSGEKFDYLILKNK